MKHFLKQIGKDSLVYGLGGAAAKIVPFFLLPIYTRVFDRGEYGILTMLNVIGGFFGALITAQMNSAQTYYFFEQKTTGKDMQAQIISAVLQWRLLIGIIILILSILISPILNQYFFDNHLNLLYFVFVFAGALFLQLMMQSINVFRLLYRPWGYIGINLGNTTITAGLALTFIFVFHQGVLGFFAGYFLSNLIFAGLGWYLVREYLNFSKIHYDLWKRLLKFSLPLMPFSLGMYILNSTDQWFIIHYHGEEMLGLYGAGAKFAVLMMMIVVTFRLAWWPVAMDALHNFESMDLFRTMARLYLGIGIILIVGLTAFAPLIVKLFTGPDFHSAYSIVAILAWYPLFYGFYLIIGGGIWKSEKTYWITIGMGVAAILNIILNIWLVPKFGGEGAAFATSFSYFMWNLITLFVSEKLWSVNYPLGTFAIQIGVGILACGGIYWFYEPYRLEYIIPIIMITYLILLLVSIDKNHYTFLYKTLQSKLKNK